MKKSSILVFQIFTTLLGLGVLVFMLWEPHLEGVNANATTLREIYFDDPFLAYMYVASLAFFFALYQVLKVLNLAKQDKLFSLDSARALRTIKYCALTFIAFILGAEGYLIVVQRKVEEDIAGGVAMGIFMILISGIIATTAFLLEKSLKNSLTSKPGFQS
jgi:uncharacterized membrane protein YkgB